MTMTEHTPGPWHVVRETTIAAGPTWIADAGTSSDARLIAAAPDMLNGLRALRDIAAMVLNRQHAGQPIADRIWSDLFQAANSASATIQKAEGG